MKKYLFLILALFFTFIMNAQFSIYSEEVGDISDGDILEFGSVAENSDANFHYEVFNDSEEPINIRVKVVSFENTTGEFFEICFGNCYYSVHEGLTYPLEESTEGYVTIQPGESQPAGEEADHFWNKDDEGLNSEEDIIYIFEFQQVDESGHFVEERLEFTYVYSPELSVDKHENFGVQILNTVVKNGELNIKTQEPAQIEIYNLLGQKFNTLKLESGINKVDVSNLSTQIYLVRIQNERGAIKTQKIVVE